MKAITLEKSFWLICKALKLFLNILTGRHNYYLCNRNNLQQPFQMPLSHKQEIFSRIFLCIFEIYIKFLTFSKKRTTSSLIYFWNYGRRKRCLNKCLKKSCLRGHFDNRHGQPVEALLKSGQRHVYHIYWCLWRQLGQKKTLLMICKVLKLFLKVLRKVRLHRTLWEAGWWTATSTVQIWRTPPLIVFDQCEGNCVRENLSYWYRKS